MQLLLVIAKISRLTPSNPISVKSCSKTNLKTMKTAFTLTILLAFILTGCNKSDVPALTPEEQVGQFVSGDGNKLWHLKAVYQNDVLQTLTAAQLLYTKTFTLTPGEKIKGIYTDNDYKGTWKLKGQYTLHIEFNDAQGRYNQIDYDIVAISDNKLDISYIANNIKIEEVYYAY